MLPASDHRSMLANKTTLWLGFILGVFITWPLLSSAQTQSRELPDKLSAKARDEADRREDLIRKEIAKLRKHEWAGEYACGGLGRNLRLILAPRSGFVFTWHGCTGLYDLNYGDARFEDGIVKLAFTYLDQR